MSTPAASQAEIFRVGLASEREQQLGPSRCRRNRSSLMCSDPSSLPVDPVDGCVKAELDSLAHRDLDQPVDDLLVVTAQKHVGPVDQGHAASELVEDPGELVGDIAAADDCDAPRQLLEMKGLVPGDRMLDALDPAA